MEQNRRFSILPFPQNFDGNTLTLNIVVLPRNQNPLRPAIEGHATIPDAAAFADANLLFEAHIVSSLAGFPNNFSANAIRGLPTVQPANARALFEALANNFSLTNLGVANNNANVNNPLNDPPPKAKTGYPVRKYLPETYRKAFNFTTPRTKAAVTDDSYHCAIRNAKKVPGFQKSPDTISWGKVFAFAMRQPKLAAELGMVYQTTLEIDPADFQHGGWLFVDLTADSDFASQQAASNNLVDGHFIKRYAARIPALTAGQPRQLFAPQLFPVLYKTNPGDADPSPDGNFDQLFIESAEYDDGFAKIVHATQPRSRNILAENDADGKPVKDAGIRLGWDDEQILIWYLRQLAEDNSVANAGKRLDAPLGVFGYAIDVRETGNPANPWETLNQVSNRIDLTVPNPPNNILLGDGQFNGELPHQVYPMQLDGDLNGTYWLPMYFANWKGHSMVLPDQDAANVYQHDQLDPTKPANAVGTEIGVPDNRLSQVYQAAPINTVLRYGGQYDFRIRMKDLSGGGPALDAAPAVESPSAIGRTPFKRYVSPNQPRIENLTVNSDGANDPDLLNINRPLLGYPAVVYTRKYADPIGRLLAASQNLAGKEAFGISDPDVNRVQITVEVETLKLDNLMSVSGKDNYVHLYTTERLFPAINDDDDYASTLPVPIEYRDVKVLHTGGETNIEADFDLPDSIDNLDAIYLPTARTIRLTMRAVCEAKEDDAEYYGIINDADHDRDSRFGHKIEVVLYRESADETDLFVDTAAAQRLQGIYMQPDEAVVFDGKIKTLLFGKIGDRAPDMIQRLAKQLDLENTGLTLVAPKGERVQFGCSSRIRHTLAPDNSSLTFASKGDLSNHWLCCVQLTIDRDWTWDALEDLSFSIERTRHFTNDGNNETEVKTVGDIEVRRAASFESLHAPKRNYTRLVFIDAVEPKNERKQPAPNQQEPRFPDTIDVSYEVVTHFKNNHAVEGQDAPEQLDILLPITTPPVQVPKIASAGIALSPYKRNEKYSATEPRQRFLWIEFAEAIKDPNDTYFARMLHYAPDQLISNNQPEQLIASQDPPLPIDPEQIRVISPGASNDLAGLNAMQAMEKANDSDRHYLLPLPPGLHANADELFGFFTYEFRVGHHRNRDTEEMVWTTAQGRFGRPLRATGIQHPAPTLMATVSRDEDKLWVTAPYATAVFNGRNVTADPPRTELWCLLYAQVRQADNEDFRNILLNDKPLDWRIEVETSPNPPSNFTRYTDAQRLTLRNITVNSLNSELSYAKISQTLKLKSLDKTNKDATKYGTVIWTNDEIAQWLDLFGLPEDSPLSILVVEFLPQITNIFDHISSLHQQQVNDNLRTTAGDVNIPNAKAATDRKATLSFERDVRQRLSPLSDELGKKRILRTSPLEEVPFVCCPSC
jgi:hypothetical protein